MKNLLAALSLIICCSFIGADNVSTRFKTPAGYTRQAAAVGSFGAWLQNLPLKPWVRTLHKRDTCGSREQINEVREVSC